MSEINEGVIFRCPNCLNSLIDVTIYADENGIYKCMKCSYQSDIDGLFKAYSSFKEKYKWISKRVTLDDQRNL